MASEYSQIAINIELSDLIGSGIVKDDEKSRIKIAEILRRAYFYGHQAGERDLTETINRSKGLR